MKSINNRKDLGFTVLELFVIVVVVGIFIAIIYFMAN